MINKSVAIHPDSLSHGGHNFSPGYTLLNNIVDGYTQLMKTFRWGECYGTSFDQISILFRCDPNIKSCFKNFSGVPAMGRGAEIS